MTRQPRRRAFTLIELLVVIAIMAVLSGISFTLIRDQESDAVMAAAYELQATIAKARALATTSNRDHAIVFHIEMPPGDAGTVLRNFTPSDPPAFQGRHWYALIGPVGSVNKGDPYPGNPINRRWMVPQRNGFSKLGHPTDPASVTVVDSDGSTVQLVEQASETEEQFIARANEFYRARVRAAQIGPRHYLPRGVRFLAVSDLDGGITRNGDLWFHGDYGFLWPRPWFGALLPNPSGGHRLFPWGGNGDAAHHFSPTAWEDQDSDGHGDNVAWDLHPDEPLVDGELMDVMLLCRGDGQINLIANYRNRSGLLSGNQEIGERSNMVFDRLTGGAHITLCRDVEPGEQIYTAGNFHDFANERDALESILPLARVFVHATDGTVEVRKGPNDPDDPFGGHEFARVRQNQRSGQAAYPGTGNQSAANFIPPRSAYHLDDGRASFNGGY